MHLIVPAPVTMATLLSSSVPVDDAPAWASGTAYAVGDRVLRNARVSTYLVSRVGVTMPTVFEAVAATTGKDPALAANVVGSRQADGTRNTAGPWARVGVAAAWRPFDGRQGERASATGSLSYEIALTSQVNAVALFRVGGGEARVRVLSSTGSLLYDSIEPAVDASHLTDMWLYLTGTPIARRTIVFSGFTAPAGSTLEVSLTGSGTQQLGEIVAGRSYRLGRLLVDPEVGYDDYSRIEYDDLGELTVIRRGFAERATFSLHLDAMEVERTLALLSAQRGLPAVFHGGDDLTRAGLTVLGLVEAPPFRIATADIAFVQLTVKGLT